MLDHQKKFVNGLVSIAYMDIMVFEVNRYLCCCGRRNITVLERNAQLAQSVSSGYIKDRVQLATYLEEHP